MTLPGKPGKLEDGCLRPLYLKALFAIIAAIHFLHSKHFYEKIATSFYSGNF